MQKTRPITVEPYGNGRSAQGRLLFLAEPGVAFRKGELLCVHTWHWPNEPDLNGTHPHVTYVWPANGDLVTEWMKEVGDHVMEGETIGEMARTKRTNTMSTRSHANDDVDQEQMEMINLARQLEIDLAGVIPVDTQKGITCNDVTRVWEKDQVIHW